MMTSRILSRADILGIANDIQTEEVQVPEWGGAVLIRGLTGAERDAFEATIIGEKADKKYNFINFRSRLVAMAAVDSEGRQLFRPSDVADLGRHSAVALQRVFAVAQRLSGLSAADVEELEKNSSGGITPAASTSD